MNMNDVIGIEFADVSKYEKFIHQMKAFIKRNRMVHV